MHQYMAFGLIINSEIEFPELLPLDITALQHIDMGDLANATLDIHLGKIPEDFILPQQMGTCVDENKEWVSIVIPFVARYCVSKTRIIIEPYEDSDQDAVRLLLLNNALGIALWWRSDLILHAAAINIDNETWVILGNSGAGKSELSAQLSLMGHSVLSDEICRITIDGGPKDHRLYVDPGISAIQLWERSLDCLNLPLENYKPVRQGLKKYFVPLNNFSMQRRRVDNIVLLEDKEILEEEFFPLKGNKKVQTIIRHCYRNQFLSEMGLLNRSFLNCSIAAKSLPVNRKVYNGDMSSFWNAILAERNHDASFDKNTIDIERASI